MSRSRYPLFHCAAGLLWLALGLILCAQAVLAQAQASKARPGARPERPGAGMANVLEDQGRELLLRKEYQAARAFYEWSARVDPGNAAAYFGRAMAWVGLGRDTLAVDDFERALELGEPPAGVLFNLALVHQRLGDPLAAEQAYTQAVLADSQFIAAYLNRGVLRLRLGKAEEARVDFELLDALRPERPLFIHLHGLTLGLLGRHPEAAADFTRVIALNPGYPRIYASRARARYESGDVAGAVDDLSIAITRAPDDGELYLTRGIALFRQGRGRAALADVSRAAELALDPAHAHLVRGRMLAALRLYPAAVEEFDAAAAAAGTSPGPPFERGIARFDMRDFERAVEDFTHTLGLDPAHADALLNRAAAQYRLQRIDLSCADWALGCERRIEAACRLRQKHCAEIGETRP